VASSKLRNVFVHDVNDDSMADHIGEYDLVPTFDVLHDAPNPAGLIAQVKVALKPNVGV
jgi:2-polyprenyl-3-methyl-5-hydroxy-6-metoxy-1,4-benzoquinol methylase